MNTRGLKNVQCEICGTSMRLCSKGVICKNNHLITPKTEEYMNLEARITGVPRLKCIECDYLLTKCICEINSGFMLKTRLM